MSNPAPFDLSVSTAHRHLHELAFERLRVAEIDPWQFIPILLRPCKVRVLLVTDGGLDFSDGNFGLSAFVDTLLKTPPGPYVRFEITVAHINSVSDAAVMVGKAGIARSIKQFQFDNTNHFKPDMYDQVWLFGIATFYNRGGNYPSNRLADTELRALSEFIDRGGGLFATGDHGRLGICLSGSIPRARSMRLWDNTPSPDEAVNEGGMSGPRRNDTNRLGHDAVSQFNDQSDDVPQTIQPKMYHRSISWWRSAFPHPLLCGPRGIIRVLPDHPHEGECVAPTDTNKKDTFSNYEITEYPPGTAGSARPLPEVIATSGVLSGTTSGGKQATQAHGFGAICAYDGHRAGVGRVVTDATWHHFVNVNLIGDTGLPAGNPKRLGFLASPAGEAHLEEIKTYFRNIAVWLSPPPLIRCMNRRICWALLWQHRVLEAVTTRLEVSLTRIDIAFFYELGRHARDVLGNYASQCQERGLILDLVATMLPAELLRLLDPWAPLPERGPRPEPDPVPWIDIEPVLDIALGGALIALREAFPEPTTKDLDRVEKEIDRVVTRGLTHALNQANDSFAKTTQQHTSMFTKRTGGRRKK